MRLSSRIFIFLLPAAASACRSLQNIATPAPALVQEIPAPKQVPDTVLLDAIRHSELIVLGVPQEMLAATGSLSPTFQLGAKETWYNVRLAVDSVAKGRLSRAKAPDFGALPPFFVPPPPFDELGPNEIVVQYPAVTTIKSDWAAAPPPVVGERAVFLFRRCWNCIQVAIGTGRGEYRANPLVAPGWGSKLDPAEWPRVAALLAKTKRSRK